MTFRRKMEHRVRIETVESCLDHLAVSDIALKEMMARRAHDLRQSLATSGISQLVDGEYLVAVEHGTAYGRGSNESSTTGDHQSHLPLRALSTRFISDAVSIWHLDRSINQIVKSG